MNQAALSQVLDAEDRLRVAMLASDVPALDRLLAPHLLFTNHLGHTQSKEDDLAAHRSGALRISVLTPSEQSIQLFGDVAIVSVRVRVEGTYNNHPANGDLRFTRVWTLSSGVPQVVVAHATVVA